MKAVIKNLTVVAVLLVSAMGLANGTSADFGKKVAAKNEVEKRLINIELDPVFVKKGQKIMMNLLNISQDKVTLKVYDSQDRLVYNESISGKLVVEKAFNFEKAFEDKYTIVVSDKNGTYKETMEVR